jgi:hypothetical protein
VAHGWAICRLVSGGQLPMQARRRLVITFTACFVALGFVVASVLADELLGVLSKVDVEGKKITVVEKDTEKEIEVKITDDTEQISGKNKTAAKVDLAKLEEKVKKAQDGNRKVNIKVTHEKNVASKLEFPKGKGKAKKQDN